jgi:hypothetical protein
MSARVKLLFSILMLSTAVFAQVERGTLRGTVTNSAGEPLANVTVSLTGVSSTMYSRQLVTDKTGNFEAPYLEPGVYKITIEERGYQGFTAEGLSIEPGQVRRYDPKLTAGSAEETVEVRVATRPLETQTGVLRDVIDNAARYDDAPVVNKIPSFFPLMTTTPGVQGNGYGLVISGISDRNRQSWTLDGITDDGNPLRYPHPLFYEFAEVTSANPNVGSYRPVGFDLVTKRGLDNLHGEIYYMRGSSAFDAAPYFAAQQPNYHLQEVGGAGGGAIFKGWTYFFGGFIRQTNSYNQTLYANVPTKQMRLGDFSQYLDPATSPTGQVVIIRDPRNGVPFANNQIPTSRIATVSNNLMNNYYQGPTGSDPNSVFQNYSWSHGFGPDLYKGYWPIVRWDQKLWSANHFYVRWIDDLVSSVQPGSIGEILDSTQSRKYRSIQVSDTWQFSPSVVNDFSLARITNFVRQGESEGVTPVTGDQPLSTAGIQGTNINGFTSAGFPTININGYTGLSMTLPGGYSDNVAQNDHTYVLNDGIAWSKGRHNVKLGVDYSHFNWLLGTVPMVNYGTFNFTGVFTGLGFADFLLGYPATSSRILNPRINSRMTQDIAGAYITDSFRITSRLTVDYGLRWDYFLAPSYTDGYMYNWDPAANTVIVAPGTLTSVSTLFPKSIKVVAGGTVPKAKTTNFRPRVSAAYRITDSTVLRGGYGEFTDSGGFGPYGGRINDPNGPFRPVETYINSNVNGLVTYAFPRPFPASPSAALNPNPSLTAIPHYTDEGTIRQYNLTLEHTIAGFGLRASYIGARGVGMNYSLDINKALPSTVPFATSRLPYPQLTSAFVTRTDGQWHYDSGQVQAVKRFGALTFDTSFTLANNVANYLNTFDPNHVTNKWTRDAADRRRYFTAAAMWTLPVGKGKRVLGNATPFVNFFLGNWTAAAITTFASGQYFTPLFTGPDPANASQGIITGLPDCIGNPNAGARTIGQWFNPAAFAAPPANSGRYGTCGVNSLESYPIHVAHMSLSKRFPLGETLGVVFTAQVSNVTNSPQFTFPQSNISLPRAGAFTALSQVPDYWPEHQGARQLDLKIRVQW